MNDLSIIILNYNNSDILKKCLASVYDSTHKITFEIVVVDNASSDNSTQMIKNDFPKIRLIENRQNLGFTKANNLGLKEASGKYFVLLNNDTLVNGGALDSLVAFMDSAPSAGACGPQLLNLNGSLQRQGGLFGRRFWRAKFPKEVDFIMGACLLVRAEAIKKVGLLDENFYFYNEDLDWCKRIRAAGWKIYFVPEAQVIHYGGYSTKKEFNSKLFIEGFRGGLYFSKKHYPFPVHYIYRLILASLFPLTAIGLILTLPLRGLADFKKRFPAYLQVFKIALFGPAEYPWPKV